MIEVIIEELRKSLTNLNILFDDEIEVSQIKNNEFGDFSSNIAMKLTKTLKSNPMEIAEKICEQIKNIKISKIEVKSPGFINFFVDKKYLVKNITEIIKLGNKYGKQEFGSGNKINYEYVSANPTGTLHVGNARGGAYGDNMSRILSFVGYEVTKEYYINDAGKQVHNLALSIQARYFELCGKVSEMPKDGYYGNEIIEIAKNLYEENKEKLLNNPIEFYEDYGISKMLVQILEDLKLYRVEFDVCTSEKSIYEKHSLKNIIEELTEKGYAYEKDGAIWLKSSELLDDKDHVLVKSDGNYSYLVPDIAYHLDKINRGYDRLVDVLGTDHHGYVNRIKSGIKAMGYDSNILDIKLLQLVKLVKDGEELIMSKRTGNAITLRELIEEIGVNATRYYFASKSLDTQMEIDLDVAIKKSNENPVYYVNYAYARICTILSNYGNYNRITEFKYINNEEKLYKTLEVIYNFPRAVRDAANKELPHLITNYIYELATSFHSLYNEYHFINDKEEITEENLNFLLAIKITMENALNLVGIIPPEKM